MIYWFITVVPFHWARDFILWGCLHVSNESSSSKLYRLGSLIQLTIANETVVTLGLLFTLSTVYGYISVLPYNVT